MTLTVIYWGCLYSSPKLHSTFAVCNIFPINTLNGWCENFVRYLPALGVFFKLRGLRNSSQFSTHPALPVIPVQWALLLIGRRVGRACTLASL